MSVARLAGIPLDHVVAELAAFPLASEAALALGPTAIDPGLASPPTVALWRAAEGALLGAFPAFSLDEIVALRDRVWFDGSVTGSPIFLATYLRRLAWRFLRVDGPVAVPCLPGDDGSASRAGPLARRAWIWLSLALPEDLLLAALGHRGAGPERVDLISPALARHLAERRYAETHLHLGAALDFPLLWNVAMHAVAEPEFKSLAFASPGAGFDEGRALAGWTVRAALARTVLAAFIGQGTPHHDLFQYLHTDLYQRLSPSIGAAGYTRLLLALDELGTEAPAARVADFATVQGLYAQITGVRGMAIPRVAAAALQADPIGALLPVRGSLRTPEVRFVSQALEYLEDPARGVSDRHFAALFWQVVRVRGLFYRHVVQRPLTPGLQWFVRFFSRLGAARTRLPRAALLGAATRVAGIDYGLRALEVRTSPDATIHGTRRVVADVEAANPSPGPNDSFELGLVFHFTKRREGGADTGRPAAFWRGTNADPSSVDGHTGNPTGYRYARFFRQRRAEAQTLAWLLAHWPLTLQTVRAVDICTDELGVPTWVMVPLFDRVRHAAHAGASALQTWFGWAPPPLRATVHAGEDFVHLLTGMRHIDEALDQLGLGEGDRIGHGIALGIEPHNWVRRAGRIAMTLEDRLLDLVWEWSWYGQQGVAPVGGRGVFLVNEIARLSEAVFEEPVDPYQLVRLRRDLCDSGRLYEAGFPDGPHPSPPPHTRTDLLVRYLTDRALFERGRRVIWVDPTLEVDALVGLQAGLRGKLGHRGITVEVNPVSNLLIGDLGDLTSHPLWRLRPPRGGGDAPPVSICVGSDDPIIFASHLRHEYQFLTDALTLAGLSEEEARQWVDRTRECGLESRFTLRRRDARSFKEWYSTQEPAPLLV